MTLLFDNHPAFDRLGEAFQAMDREGIVAALDQLGKAATSMDDRRTLDQLCGEGLQRLAALDPRELPKEVDAAAVMAWTAQVALDLLDAGGPINGSRDAQVDVDEDGEDDQVEPLELAVHHRNWPLIRALVGRGANPLARYGCEDVDDDTQGVSVIGAMMTEASADVALDLLSGPLDLPHWRQHRPPSSTDEMDRLSVTSVAGQDAWTVDERVRLARRVMELGEPAAAGLNLVRSATRGRSGAIEVMLATGTDVAYGTTMEIRWVPPAQGLSTATPPLTQLKRLLHRDYTALHAAALHGQIDAAAVLLGRGADVSAATTWGATPLHLAAMHGSQAMIDLLVAHGAVPDQLDAQGVAPRGWAEASKHEEAAAHLLDLVRRPLIEALAEAQVSIAPSAPLVRSRL